METVCKNIQIGDCIVLVEPYADDVEILVDDGRYFVKVNNL